LKIEGTCGPELDSASLRERGLRAPPFHLGEMLATAADRRADGRWICGRPGEDEITYGAAQPLAQRAAGAFMRDGLSAGDRVVILMPNHVSFGVIVWGAWLAGASVCAMHPAYPDTLLAAQLDDLAPHSLVTLDEPDLLARAARLAHGRMRVLVLPHRGPLLASLGQLGANGSPISFAAWIAGSGPRTPVAPDLDAPALLQFTGGSTGTPKAAVLTHRNLSTNHAQLAQTLTQLTPGGERLLAVAPFAHVIGFSVNLCFGTYLSSTVILEPRFDPDRTAQLCLDQHITFINAVPTLLKGLQRSPIAMAGDWCSLKCVIAGGAPLPPAIRSSFESLTRCKVQEGYGLSETSPAVLLGHPSWGNPPGSIGNPIAGTRIVITASDDPGRVMNTNEVGEIRIAGPQVMRGYWRKPEETAAALPDGLLRTGDLGTVDTEGNVYIVGRLKELIIASGYNVYPSRVEDAVLTHDAVDEAAVIGVADEYRGETVKAVVVLKPGRTLTLEELQAWLKSRLSPMEVPRLLEIRTHLPKSPAGKTFKPALRDPLDQNVVAPESG